MQIRDIQISVTYSNNKQGKQSITAICFDNLAVHRSASGVELYTITHIPSGLRMASYKKLPSAIAAIKKLNKVSDWNLKNRKGKFVVPRVLRKQARAILKDNIIKKEKKNG